MADAPTFQAPPEAPQAPAEAAAPPKTPTEPAAAAPEATPDISGWLDGKTPELTAENASKVIAAIREDFKAERQKLRDGDAAKQAVADAETALTQRIGKALGLVKDDEPADPAKLTEQAAKSAADAKQARVELAVFRNAEAAGADPLALLDSASFLAKVRDLDPSDPAALSAAITEAVTANPRLGAATAPQGMKPNPAQGRSATPPLGLEQQIDAAQKAGDLRTALRLKAQQSIQKAT